MWQGESIRYKQEILVSELLAVCRETWDKGLHYVGEGHKSCVLFVVDKGRLTIQVGEREWKLCKGEGFFLLPETRYRLYGEQNRELRFVVIAFVCENIDVLCRCAGNTIQLSTRHRELVWDLAMEIERAMQELPGGDGRRFGMRPRPDAPFGAQQMAVLSLERLLLLLVRQRLTQEEEEQISSEGLHRYETEVTYANVVSYLEKRLPQKVSLEEVCRDTHYGSSHLQKVFRKKCGGGVIEQYGKMRIQRAIEMIGEGSKTFTQVAKEMGYTSIHYFSRHFKRVTGMTPTEYAVLLKTRSAEANGSEKSRYPSPFER